MADEVLEFAFQATGQDVVQKAFEDLKIKQLENSNEAKRLATALRELSGAEALTAEEAEEVQRAMIRAQQAATQYGTQARQITAQTRQQAQASAQQATAVTQSARSFGQMGSALGQVGGLVAHISPQFGAMGQIVGQVGGAVTGLTGAMGPVGIAIGAVTAAVGLAIPLYQRFADEAHELSDAQQGVVDRTNALVTAMRRQRAETRLLTQGSSTDLQPQVESAAAAVEQFNDQLTVSRQELERLQAAQERAGSIEVYQGLGEEIATVTARMGGQSEALRIVTADLERYRAAQTRAVQRELGEGAEDDAARQQEAAEDRAARRRGSGGDAAARRRREAEQAAREAERLAAQRVEKSKEAARAEAEAFENAALAKVNSERRALEQIASMREFFHERDVQLAERRAEIAEENKANSIARAESERAQVMETYQTLGAGVQNIGNSITDLAGQMIKLAVSGADKGGDAYLRLLDAFLESTAIEYTIKALGEGANAIAAYARYDYAAGTQHLIAAGLAAGVAAATGIGAAAINVPPAPAAGGGAATAQQAGGGAGGQAGPTNITIQLFAPQAVFTEAERGQIIANGVRAARRESGPASVRF